MKRSTTIAATVLGLSLALASEAVAVPVTTAFTARIEDGTGPINGLVNLNFKIFDAGTAGTMVWEEMHTGVSADEGLVYVALGSIAPTTNGLDETVFTGGALFLEVTVNGDTQSPRVPILSVPYATRAATADTLGNLGPSDVALSNHTHAGVYAPASHTHSEYALTTHDHAGVYAPATHVHPEYALSTHNHDSQYYTQASLNTAGTINAAANPVDWTKLKGVPVGLADGTDDIGVGTVTAGSGLTGGGSTSSVTLSVATGGITSTHLASSSVTSAKIAANAVGTSELNVPALFTAGRNASSSLTGLTSSTFVDVVSDTITIPTPGTVVAIASTENYCSTCNSTNNSVTYELVLCDTACTSEPISLIGGRLYYNANAVDSSGYEQMNTSLHRAFPFTTAGAKTIRVRARRSGGTGSLNIFRAKLTLYFIPN